MILNLSFWAIVQPIFDWFHAWSVGDDFFQVRMIFGQVRAKHEVHVIGDAQQEYIGPG